MGQGRMLLGYQNWDDLVMESYESFGVGLRKRVGVNDHAEVLGFELTGTWEEYKGWGGCWSCLR